MKIIPLLLMSTTMQAASLIDAIAISETGIDHSAIGDGGVSRGAWQMSQAAWYDACKEHNADWLWIRDAHDEHRSRMVAIWHLERIERNFRYAGINQPTAAQIYAAWNLGFWGFKRLKFDVKRVPMVTKRGIARMNEALKGTR